MEMPRCTGRCATSRARAGPDTSVPASPRRSRRHVRRGRSRGDRTVGCDLHRRIGDDLVDESAAATTPMRSSMVITGGLCSCDRLVGVDPTIGGRRRASAPAEKLDMPVMEQVGDHVHVHTGQGASISKSPSIARRHRRSHVGDPKDLVAQMPLTVVDDIAVLEQLVESPSGSWPSSRKDCQHVGAVRLGCQESSKLRLPTSQTFRARRRVARGRSSASAGFQAPCRAQEGLDVGRAGQFPDACVTMIQSGDVRLHRGSSRSRTLQRSGRDPGTCCC